MIRYIDIENDISIFSIYRIITTVSCMLYPVYTTKLAQRALVEYTSNSHQTGLTGLADSSVGVAHS